MIFELDKLFSLVLASCLSPRFRPKRNSKMPFYHHPPFTANFWKGSVPSRSHIFDMRNWPNIPTQPIYHTLPYPLGRRGAKSCMGLRSSRRLRFFKFAHLKPPYITLLTLSLKEKGPKSYIKVQSLSKVNIFDISLVHSKKI